MRPSRTAIAGHRGQHALGDRVGRIDPRRVAELGDDVALVDDDAVGLRADVSAPSRAACRRCAPDRRSPSRAFDLARLGERHRLGQLRRIHPEIAGRLRCPGARRGEVARRCRWRGRPENADEQRCEGTETEAAVESWHGAPGGRMIAVKAWGQVLKLPILHDVAPALVGPRRAKCAVSRPDPI